MQKINNKNQSGFTLIELIVVIVILGILAATAAPKFINLKEDAERAKLKATASAIASAASLNYAKYIMNPDKTENYICIGAGKCNSKTYKASAFSPQEQLSTLIQNSTDLWPYENAKYAVLNDTSKYGKDCRTTPVTDFLCPMSDGSNGNWNTKNCEAITYNCAYAD